jgi:hypothetical protein
MKSQQMSSEIANAMSVIQSFSSALQPALENKPEEELIEVINTSTGERLRVTSSELEALISNN